MRPRASPRAIVVLGTGRGGVADQATFYVELIRACDNVVLLTDDREALIEALETSPAEKATVLDEATREKRKAAERFLDGALSAAAVSIRQRGTRTGGRHLL